MKTWVVDLDGCLCNDAHRRIAAGLQLNDYAPMGSNRVDWGIYFSPELILKDSVNTILADAIRCLPEDYFVLYLTGRMGYSDVLEATKTWLLMHGLVRTNSVLYMREIGNQKIAQVFKTETLQQFKSRYPEAEFVLGVSDREEDLIAYAHHKIPGLIVKAFCACDPNN